MPTYEYECEACGHAFERFQSMSDKPVKKCPECKKLKVRRLIGSGAGIIFKGSGFYETDYKRKSAPAAGESGTAAKSDPAPAAKADTAPAKTESKPATAKSK